VRGFENLFKKLWVAALSAINGGIVSWLSHCERWFLRVAIQKCFNHPITGFQSMLDYFQTSTCRFSGLIERSYFQAGSPRPLASR